METWQKPWMQKIDPWLLTRYWRSQGCPGTLEVHILGMVLYRKKVRSGEVVWADPLPSRLHQEEINRLRSRLLDQRRRK